MLELLPPGIKSAVRNMVGLDWAGWEGVIAKRKEKGGR